MRNLVYIVAFYFAGVALLPGFLHAQSPNVGILYLNGKIVNEKKKGIEADIIIFKNGARIDRIRTSNIGKFEYPVPLQDSIALVVSVPGYVSKTVFIDSRVPLNLQKADYGFPFFIDLYPVGSIPSNIDLSRPVGKIIFSGTQFIYDIAFTRMQNERLKEFVRERKNMKIRELD